MDEAAIEKIYAAEHHIAAIRLGIVLFNSGLSGFFMDRAGTLPWLAYVTIAVSAACRVVVLALESYRRFPRLLSSQFSALSDALFVALWILATGGFYSPFSMLWYVSQS